jgi:homoserine O-acetyltransferase
MGQATHYLKRDIPFRLHRGGELPNVTVAWECWGELNASHSNAVLVFTGLSASAHAASNDLDSSPGWWEGIIGPQKAIDTNRFFVICVNSLGSCLGSTGPQSIHSKTKRPWRLDFPELAIEDIAAAAELVVTHLGIDKLYALVGPSMGGMSALAWLKGFPHRTKRIALISTACASSPFALAIRSLQREAIVTDRNFHDGQYDDDNWPEVGMKLARKLGMITYRSSVEWDTRFGRRRQDYFPQQPFGMRFEVESYLETHARKFVGQFDPCSYLYLSRAMDMFDACEGSETLAQMFARTFEGQALVLGVDSDILFPSHLQQELAVGLEASGSEVSFEILRSNKGHDAFLVDSFLFEKPLRSWLG